MCNLEKSRRLAAELLENRLMLTHAAGGGLVLSNIGASGDDGIELPGAAHGVLVAQDTGRVPFEVRVVRETEPPSIPPRATDAVFAEMSVEPAEIGLLLPAIQKVTNAQETTQVVADLKNPSNEAQIGLLLPAVQKVREAAANLPDLPEVGRPEHPGEPSLLLPAVQKVRDTATRTQEVADLKNPSDNAQIGLLLPAIQKVR